MEHSFFPKQVESYKVSLLIVVDFFILCSTPYLASAFVKLEVEHRIRISKLKDHNHLQMYRGHAGIFSLGNQDPCNSVIMDISKIFLSQKGSISSSKFELFLPV